MWTYIASGCETWLHDDWRRWSAPGCLVVCRPLSRRRIVPLRGHLRCAGWSPHHGWPVGGCPAAGRAPAFRSFDGHDSAPCVRRLGTGGSGRSLDSTVGHDSRAGLPGSRDSDALGKSTFAKYRRILAPRGRLVFLSFKLKQIRQMLWTSIGGGRRVMCALVSERQEDLVEIRRLMEAGTLRTVVDRSFPLEQAAEAHRYAESGAKTGAVVITVPGRVTDTVGDGSVSVCIPVRASRNDEEHPNLLHQTFYSDGTRRTRRRADGAPSRAASRRES